MRVSRMSLTRLCDRYDLDLHSDIEVKDLPRPDAAHLEMLAEEISGLEAQKIELTAKGDRDMLRDTVNYVYEKYANQVLFQPRT